MDIAVTTSFACSVMLSFSSLNVLLVAYRALYFKCGICLLPQAVSSACFFSGVWDMLSRFFVCLTIVLLLENGHFR